MTVPAVRADDTPPLTRLRQLMIMATVTVASTLVIIDLFVISIALPHMQGTFSATPDQISWVVTAFILGATVMIVCTGWVSSIIGVKRLFVLSIVGFVVVSTLCAHAQTLEAEVMWRLVHGIVAAPLMLLAQVILLDAYPRARHGRALAIWGVGGMVGAIVAPPIAGVVIDVAGWLSVFYINVPIALLALFGALLAVPKVQAKPQYRLDLVGLIMLVAIFGLLQFVLNRGDRADWLESTEIIIAILLAGFCAYLLLVHIFTARNPILPGAVLRDWNFMCGMMANFVFAGSTLLMTFLVPLLLKNQLGYPVELIGLIMGPRDFGTLLGHYIVAVLILRIDPRHLIVVGALMSATATWIMSGWSLDLTPWPVVWMGMLQGCGSGTIWVAISALSVATLEGRYRPQAVPLFYLSFNVGLSVGIAGIITYWAQSTQSNYALLTEFVSPFNELVRGQFLPPGWDPANPAVAATIANEIYRQSAMIAYDNCFFVMTIATLVLVPMAYLFHRIPRAAAH